MPVNPGTAVNNGMYGGTVALTSGTAYTFTAYLYGAVGIPYTAYFATTAGASKGTPGTATGTGDWQRSRRRSRLTRLPASDFT